MFRTNLFFCVVMVFAMTSGCEDSQPAAPAEPVAQAPGAPQPWADPTSDETAPPEDTAPPAPVELSWFKGVDELPAEHPCHDSTSVLWVNEQGPEEVFSRRKLGELRASADIDYVHLGPRTVRGVRWKAGDRQFLVASCTMKGAGFAEYDGKFEDQGHPSDSAAFVVTYGGEPYFREWGEVRWMHRDGEGSWQTAHHESAWASSYMGSEPAIARGEILGAEVLDSDGLVEVTAFTVEDCGRRTEMCPKETVSYPMKWPFVVTVLAREGTDQRSEKVLLRNDAKVLRVEREERPQSMTDEVAEALESRLDRDRDAAVEKAIAILREENKLR